MGADGPFTVIQNYGANEYVIDMQDVLRRGDFSGKLSYGYFLALDLLFSSSESSPNPVMILS